MLASLIKDWRDAPLTVGIRNQHDCLDASSVPERIGQWTNRNLFEIKLCGASRQRGRPVSDCRMQVAAISSRRNLQGHIRRAPETSRAIIRRTEIERMDTDEGFMVETGAGDLAALEEFVERHRRTARTVTCLSCVVDRALTS